VRPDGTPVSPKLIGKFTAGSLTRNAVVQIKCPSCDNIAVITDRNQYGDGRSTFIEGTLKPPNRIGRADAAMVASST
jgi:hypothetical protein